MYNIKSIKKLYPELNQFDDLLLERKLECKDGERYFIKFSEKNDGDKYNNYLDILKIGWDEIGPEEVIFMWSSNVVGYLIIDNLDMGIPSLGGIRMRADIDVVEIANLARGMTLKNAASNLEYGGGKGGIKANPNSMSVKEKRRIVSSYAKLIQEYVDVFNPGPDVGIDDEDMKTIAIENGLDNVVSKTEDMGGNRIDILGAAAGGGVIAIGSILKNFKKLSTLTQFKKFNLIDSKVPTVIIQGFGAVGANVAKFLLVDPIIRDIKGRTVKTGKIVGISDADGYLYCKNGLDISQILSDIGNKKEVSRKYFTKRIMNKWDKEENCTIYSNAMDELLTKDADIFVPATYKSNYVGINEKSDPSITLDKAGTWDIIVEGANTYEINKEKRREKRQLEQILYRRGTFLATDFLVNVGGVIFASYEKTVKTPKELQIPDYILGNREKVEEWLKKNKKEFKKLAKERRRKAEKKREESISKNIDMLVDILIDNDDVIPSQAAERIAIDRITNKKYVVGNIMSTDIPFVYTGTSVKIASKKLIDSEIGICIVVSKENGILGVLTEWDIAKLISMGKKSREIVDNIMTKKVITIKPDSAIFEAITKFKNHRISRMPVISNKKNVVGILTTDMLVKNTLFKLLPK